MVGLPVEVASVEQPKAVVLRSFQEDQPSAEVEDVLEVQAVAVEVLPEVEAEVAEVASVLEDAMVP